MYRYDVADPDLEIKGFGVGGVLFCLPCWLVFLFQIKGSPSLGPPLDIMRSIAFISSGTSLAEVKMFQQQEYNKKFHCYFLQALGG